eukprot:3885716-Lingulodinium_polyedra.AAC.1
MFDKSGGSQCRPCAVGVESYQRRLRKLWGKEYKHKYRALAADRATWKSQIQQFMAVNAGKTKRKLTAEMETLGQERAKGKRRSHIR